MKPGVVRIMASPAQHEDFEKRSDLTEYLLALSLAAQVAGKDQEAMLPSIVEWFKSVRTLAVTNHALSGIRIVIADLDEHTPPSRHCLYSGQGLVLTGLTPEERDKALNELRRAFPDTAVHELDLPENPSLE
jgi:hypothetical protein